MDFYIPLPLKLNLFKSESTDPFYPFILSHHGTMQDFLYYSLTGPVICVDHNIGLYFIIQKKTLNPPGNEPVTVRQFYP